MANLSRQRRILDNTDGSKVLQERIIEVNAEKNDTGETIFIWDWEDICTVTADMQKDKSLTLTCFTNWLSKEG